MACFGIHIKGNTAIRLRLKSSFEYIKHVLACLDLRTVKGRRGYASCVAVKCHARVAPLLKHFSFRSRVICVTIESPALFLGNRPDDQESKYMY